MKSIYNESLMLSFDAVGTLCAFRFDGVDFISSEWKRELFRFCLRDICGNPENVSARDFGKVEITKAASDTLELRFESCAKFKNITVCADIQLNGDESLWRIRLAGIPDGYELEYIVYPIFAIKSHFVSDGGTGRFFWPGYEGCLIDDMTERERFGMGREWIEYPMSGVDGFYPGPCAMQMQLWYTDEAGLYFACHDAEHSPKGIYVRSLSQEAIEPCFQHFTGGGTQIAYDTVLAGFHGDWQDGVLRYRNWMERCDATLPPPLSENRENPAWLTDSPVIAIYPVKGEGIDNGSQEPNEYFPYSNAMPVINQLHERWDAPIMALLMHWEGTAPWAPPYIWPPFGGCEMLCEFADALHRRGCLLGVYASGIGWTQQSSIEPGYNCERIFAEKQVEREICTGPRGERYSRVCNGRPGIGQRIGYDLCPTREFTAQTVENELRNTVTAGVDYLQYFDQNQGCAAPLCYGSDHGHPRQPGAWQTAAMRKLLARSGKAVKNRERKVVLGCENAAAEPYIGTLQLNDLRSHLAFFIGALPVPAYSMLFHRYVNGFTGNGVGMAGEFDESRSPEYLAYIIGAGVAAGNIISVVLKEQGKIHYSWGRLWSYPEPEQSSIFDLIGNLNRHRRSDARKFLVYGEMLKAPENESVPYILHFRYGRKPRSVPSVLVTRWRSGEEEAIILINYRRTPERVKLEFAPEQGGTCVLEVPPLDMLVHNTATA